MSKIKSLLAILTAAVLLALSSPAHAGPCFQYSVVDSFEGPNQGGWSPWNNSSTGTILFAADANAISGTGDVKMSFFWFESTSSFLVVDKAFDVTSSTYRVATNAPGCNSIVPWPPSGNPVSCTAGVYIRPTGGATGLLELLDPATYVIIAQKTFSYSASSSWTFAGTPTVSGCKRNMVARVEMDHPGLTNETMYADALFITWNY